MGPSLERLTGRVDRVVSMGGSDRGVVQERVFGSSHKTGFASRIVRRAHSADLLRLHGGFSVVPVQPARRGTGRSILSSKNSLGQLPIDPGAQDAADTTAQIKREKAALEDRVLCTICLGSARRGRTSSGRATKSTRLRLRAAPHPGPQLRSEDRRAHDARELELGLGGEEAAGTSRKLS